MYLILNDEVAIPLVPRFYNLVDEDDSFSRLIVINSVNTASTHEQSANGICYLQNSRTLPHWIASGTDYQSITTNLDALVLPPRCDTSEGRYRPAKTNVREDKNVL